MLYPFKGLSSPLPSARPTQLSRRGRSDIHLTMRAMKMQGENNGLRQIFEKMEGKSMEHTKISLGEQKDTEDTYREQVKEKVKKRRKLGNSEQLPCGTVLKV